MPSGGFERKKDRDDALPSERSHYEGLDVHRKFKTRFLSSSLTSPLRQPESGRASEG